MDNLRITRTKEGTEILWVRKHGESPVGIPLKHIYRIKEDAYNSCNSNIYYATGASTDSISVNIPLKDVIEIFDEQKTI